MNSSVVKSLGTLVALLLLGAAAYFVVFKQPGSSTDRELMDAAKAGDAAKVKALLDGGAAIDATFHASKYQVMSEGEPPESGYTALHFASENGKLAVVKILLDKKAKTEIKNFYGNTPLLLAVNQTQKDIIAELLKHGADAKAINGAGRGALEIAQKRNMGPTNFAIVSMLKQAGAVK